jgi:hypothetical protein
VAAFFQRMGLDLQRGVRQEDIEQAFRSRAGGFGRSRGDDSGRRRGGDAAGAQRGDEGSNSNERGGRGFRRFGGGFSSRFSGGGADDGQARERAERLAQRWVQRYDRNEDGVLASDEIPDQLRGELGSLDANSDGILSADELANRYAPATDDAQRGSNDTQRPFPFVAGPSYPAGLPSWFQQSDANRDGQVALYEWDRRQLAQFKAYDHNEDGFITTDEAIRSNQRSSAPTAVGGRAFGGRGNFGFSRGSFGGGRGSFGGGRGSFGGGRGNFGSARGNFGERGDYRSRFGRGRGR